MRKPPNRRFAASPRKRIPEHRVNSRSACSKPRHAHIILAAAGPASVPARTIEKLLLAEDIMKPAILSLLFAASLAALPASAQDWAKAQLAKSPRHSEWVSVKHDGRSVETF